MIRIIVAHELPRTDNNAILHLLSASPEQVRYGVEHYEQHSPDTSSLLSQLFEGYKREGLAMPYTMQDFRRDYVKEHLKDLTFEELLQGLPLEKWLRDLPPEERLRGLSPEERLRGLPAEERLRGLPAEERLRGLPPKEIEEYLQRRKKRTSPKRKNHKK